MFDKNLLISLFSVIFCSGVLDSKPVSLRPDQFSSSAEKFLWLDIEEFWALKFLQPHIIKSIAIMQFQGFFEEQLAEIVLFLQDLNLISKDNAIRNSFQEHSVKQAVIVLHAVSLWLESQIDSETSKDKVAFATELESVTCLLRQVSCRGDFLLVPGEYERIKNDWNRLQREHAKMVEVFARLALVA